MYRFCRLSLDSSSNGGGLLNAVSASVDKDAQRVRSFLRMLHNKDIVVFS